MSDLGPLQSATEDLARHIVARLQEDADFARVFTDGHVGELSSRYLCRAMAEVSGRSVAEIEAEVRAIRHARPRSLSASDEERAEHYRQRAANGNER